MKKIKDIFFILILSVLSTVLLVGMSNFTRPIIEKNKEIKLKIAVLEAAGIPFTQNNIDRIFEENIKVKEEKGFKYYLTEENNYIFTFRGYGLWGPIEGAINLNKDLKTIERVRIISQEETPGLGGRITEEGYLSQFHNKKVSPRLKVTLRTKASKDNEIDAITGASITSEALVRIINQTVKKFREIKGG